MLFPSLRLSLSLSLPRSLAPSPPLSLSLSLPLTLSPSLPLPRSSEVPLDPRYRPTVGSHRVAFSYERGTSVHVDQGRVGFMHAFRIASLTPDGSCCACIQGHLAHKKGILKMPSLSELETQGKRPPALSYVLKRTKNTRLVS